MMIEIEVMVMVMVMATDRGFTNTLHALLQLLDEFTVTICVQTEVEIMQEKPCIE